MLSPDSTVEIDRRDRASSPPSPSSVAKQRLLVFSWRSFRIPRRAWEPSEGQITFSSRPMTAMSAMTAMTAIWF